MCDRTHRVPFFVHGGVVSGSVFLSLSPPTSVHYMAGSPAQHPYNLDVEPVPKKHLRPCKGKRLRFRKLIDNLKVKVRQELENFDVDDITLPMSIANDPKTVARVKSMMGNYRDQVLAGIAVPDLDANDLKMIAKQGPNMSLPCDIEMSL